MDHISHWWHIRYRYGRGKLKENTLWTQCIETNPVNYINTKPYGILARSPKYIIFHMLLFFAMLGYSYFIDIRLSCYIPLSYQYQIIRATYEVGAVQFLGIPNYNLLL